MRKTGPDYRNIWHVIDNLIKIMIVRREDSSGGYASATGLLSSYLAEVINELPASRRKYWFDVIGQRTRELEREIILQRLTQKENHE